MPRMENASGDIMFLIAELKERKLPKLLSGLAKMEGTVVPSLSLHEHNAVRRVGRLHSRMKLGDYRLSGDELDQLRDVAAWVLYKTYYMRKTIAHRVGQKFPHMEPVLNWSGNNPPNKMLPPGSYLDIVNAVHDGRLDAAVQ